jgi:predicted dehydrogenase
MTTPATPFESSGGPGDVYGHTPLDKMFAGADVYGVGFDHHRADRRPLRLAMIGAGGVAQSKWLPALARLGTLWDPVELVGVADPNEDQGHKVGRVHGCRWYRDHRQLLIEEKPDVVVVATPDRFHAEHVEDALEMGAAALVEKPFCASLAEAARLCDVSAATGATLMPVANLRFSPPFRRARQFLSNLTGFSSERVLLGRMQLGYDYVDLLEGATVHLFDLARFLLGDVVEVRARGLGRAEGERRYPCRQAVVSLDFGPGGAAQLFTSSSALSLKPWLRVEVHGQGTTYSSSCFTIPKPGRPKCGSLCWQIRSFSTRSSAATFLSSSTSSRWSGERSSPVSRRWTVTGRSSSSRRPIWPWRAARPYHCRLTRTRRTPSWLCCAASGESSAVGSIRKG